MANLPQGLNALLAEVIGPMLFVFGGREERACASPLGSI